MMYNLWIWESPSWRVFASYETQAEAYDAAKRSGDPPNIWLVATAGGQLDEHIRANCTEREIPLPRARRES